MATTVVVVVATGHLSQPRPGTDADDGDDDDAEDDDDDDDDDDGAVWPRGAPRL